MRTFKSMVALSTALALAWGQVIADPETASTLSSQMQQAGYQLPQADHQVLTTAGAGTPELGQAVGHSVAGMTRTLVQRGEASRILAVVPQLIDALPGFAAEITKAAVDNVPVSLKQAVREAATSAAPALGLGGLEFPPPPSNSSGSGAVAPTSPN